MAAMIIAPVAAIVVAASGFAFPFPRILDRTIMVTLFAILLLFAHRLKLLDFLRQGFSTGQVGVWQTLSGLTLAAGAIGVLFALAAFTGGNIRGAAIAASVLRYLPAAMLIGVIEEGFFRTFLLAGIEGDLGSSGALFASSAIFAIVHVMRSPARFYLTRFEPWAGAKTLAAYGERIIRPEVGPLLLGLFLLGLVLGKAFVITRRAYASLGLHAGFVLGAKTWRLAVGGAIPRWLAGPGPVPLVAAPAAWVSSAIMLMTIWLWLGPNQHTFQFLNRKRAAYRAAECDSGDGSTETVLDNGGRSLRWRR
ncbi:MAG: CPBP family intramembrane metalloprotease [Deltaproteobacteria bacterium]|nr:CPBP family intramembrane metalloprotease [Deltaproteobacteria bacterium]